MARPSKFTLELAVEICRRVADGRSLRSVCRDEDMPNADTVNEWRINRAEFSEQYARARERRAEVLADEILDIADNAEDAQIARLQVDARKWAASKLDPKRYGDRLDIDATVRKAEVSENPLTDEQWAASYAVNRLATAAGTTESTD